MTYIRFLLSLDIQEIIFIFKFFLEILCMIFLWIILGYPLVKKIMPSIKVDEKGYYSFAVGITIYGFCAFILGICGILTPLILVISIGIILLSGYYALYITTNSVKKQHLKFLIRRKYPINIVLLMILILAIFIGLGILATLPPMGADDGGWHLYLPKIFSQTGKIEVIENALNPAYDIFMEVIYTTLFWIDNTGRLCQVLEFCFFIASLIVLVSEAKKAYDIKVGILAVILISSCTLILWQTRNAYIDQAYTFYSLLSIFACRNYLLSDDINWVIFSGIFLGTSSTIKYNGLFFCLIIGLIVLVKAIKLKKVKPLIALTSTAAFICVPNYFFNWIKTGNPVFPYFPEIFPSQVWPADRYIDFFGRMNDAYGVEKTFVNFLKLPILITKNMELFVAEGYINPVIWGLLLCSVAYSLHRREKNILFFDFISVMFLLYWFIGSQQLRYLAIICFIVAIPCGYICNRFINIFKNKYIKEIVYSGICIGMLCVPYIYLQENLVSINNYPNTKEETDTYLMNCMYPYEAIDYLNEYDKNAVCYSLDCERLNFYSEFYRVGDHNSYYNHYDMFFGKDGKELYRVYKEYGVNYFLWVDVNNHGYTVPNDEYFESHFMPVYVDAHAILYKLADLGYSENVGGDEMLLNGSLDTDDNGATADWYSYYGGWFQNKDRLVIPENSQMFQRVELDNTDIKAGDILRLKMNAACEAGGTIEMTISWFKEDEFITNTYESFKTNESEEEYICDLSVKKYADSLVVMLTSSEGENEIQDISLKKMIYTENKK